MASPVNPAMASGSSQINSSDQSESDNSPRTHHVLSMLSGFANQYLSEWGLYPGMAQDMESLRVENAALKKELLISSTDVKKLWQDNEALDRHAKALVQERDALKFRVDVHTQDPHSLQTLCLNLKQENDELRRKHVFLAGNIERLVNDGLQLGYLVKSPANNDSLSLNVHFKRPQSHPSANQPRLLAPKVSQHDSVPVTSTPVQRQQSRTPSAVFTPQASPVIDSTQRISPNAVYPSTQSPSQPQHMAHRSQQNRVSSGSPVRQHFSQTGVASQPGTQAFIPTQAQLLVSHKNTQQHSHSHTQPGVRLPQHPSFSSSATTTQPIMRGSQQRSASLPHPLSQVQAPPQSHSESQRPRPAIFQNSSVPSLPSRFVSSPVPSSPVAQSPPNNHHWNPTLPQPPPASSPYPAIHNPAAAPESSQVSVTEVQALEKSSVPGRAPPTPPQSDKSLSPEQEHDLRLPATPLVIRPEPHKRGSTEMEPGDEGRQSSPKRIRLHGGIAQHQPGVNLDGWTNVRPLREPDDAQMTGSRGRSNQQGTDGDAQRSPRAMISLEPMTVDKEVIDLTAPVTPSLAGGEEQAAQVAKAQEKEEVIEPPVTVIEGRFNGAFVPVPEAAPTSIAIVSEASTSAAEDAAPATADQRNAVDQAEDSESDDDSDDSDDDSEDSDTQGRSERSSARFLLKSKAGRKVCRLCRTRVKKYPGQYEHTIFDRDTPLLVLVGHFSRVHTTAWCKLRGLPIPEGVSAQSPTAAAVSVS